jgi:hypothetical protein
MTNTSLHHYPKVAGRSSPLDAGIGAKFAIRAPREPPGVFRLVGLPEAVVRPETVEPLEDVATDAKAVPELKSDAAATVPWPELRRFG